MGAFPRSNAPSPLGRAPAIEGCGAEAVRAQGGGGGGFTHSVWSAQLGPRKSAHPRPREVLQWSRAVRRCPIHVTRGAGRPGSSSPPPPPRVYEPANVLSRNWGSVLCTAGPGPREKEFPARFCGKTKVVRESAAEPGGGGRFLCKAVPRHGGRGVLKREKKVFLNGSFAKRSRVTHTFNHGRWRLAVGGWWRLVVGGGWWLAVGGPLVRSLRAALNKKN